MSAAKKIGKRIRFVRDTRGMSQAVLAEKAGIGRMTVIDIEGGKVDPRIGTVESIAGGLGVPLLSLVMDEIG